MAEKIDNSVCEEQVATQSTRSPQDGIIVFKETFNFSSYVKDNLTGNSIYGSFDSDETIAETAKIVGQERDGTILMAWDAPFDNKSKTMVTHVGMYSQLSPSHRTLYSHNEQINVCGASIDQSKTLLAFTICEKNPHGLSYDTYVAEIRPCNRVFSLNLSSPDFRKLQFICNKTKQPMGNVKNKRTSQLLVVIPDNWVCLYSFQLEPVEKGFTVINQPGQSVVVKDFPWYHWDPHRQWLAYARFSVPSVASSHRPGNDHENMLIIHVVDFSQKLQNVVVTFSLPLFHSIDHYTNTSTYYDSSLSFCLPVLELNMKVLHNDDGLWCVCLQHSTGQAESISKSSKKGIREFKIGYTVYILHNGHMIDGEVILTEPSDKGHYIQFLLLGNFVIAYVPGVMFHLLNVGTQTDPCHHLILNYEHAPSLPCPEGGAMDGYSKSRILEDAVLPDVGLDRSHALFDPVNCVFYTCQLNPKALFDLFINSEYSRIRESLIHLTIVGLREHSYGLHMIEHICQTPLSLEDPKLFHEFILALTYSSMHSECQRFFARHLPLTNTNCYRGCIQRNPEGKIYAFLRCSEIVDFYKQLLVQSDQKLVSASPDTVLTFNPSAAEPVLQLSYNALLNQSKMYRRLNLIEIAHQVTTMSMSTPAFSTIRQCDKGSDTLGRSGNFMEKIKVFLHSSKPQSTSSLSSNLPFLLPDEDLTESITIRTDLLRGRVQHILSHQLMLQSKHNQSQLHSVVKLYLAELKKTSQTLLQIIWSSLKFSNENHPLQSSLHRQPSLEEEVLFELLESYNLVHIDIGLQPPTGFMTLFICVGYLCLEPSVFVNYLRNHVFTPTKVFLDLLLSDCEGVDDDFLFEILSHIDEGARMDAMKRWKHPVLQLWLNKLPSAKQPSH